MKRLDTIQLPVLPSPNHEIQMKKRRKRGSTENIFPAHAFCGNRGAACGPRFPYLSFPDAYVLLGRAVARYTIRLARVESLREPITWCIIHNAWPVPPGRLPRYLCRRARAPVFLRRRRHGGLEKKAEGMCSVMDRRERQIRFRLLAFLGRSRRRRSDKRAWMFFNACSRHQTWSIFVDGPSAREKAAPGLDCRGWWDGRLDYGVIEGKHVVTLDIPSLGVRVNCSCLNG